MRGWSWQNVNDDCLISRERVGADIIPKIHLKSCGQSQKFPFDIPKVSPKTDRPFLKKVTVIISTYSFFTFLTRKAKSWKRKAVLMTRTPLFHKFFGGNTSSICFPEIAKIKPWNMAIVPLHWQRFWEIKSSPPQKRARGPFIKKCCRPKNICWIWTLRF